MEQERQLFQTPAERIYTIANYSRVPYFESFKLQWRKFTLSSGQDPRGANIEFQTPAEDIYTLRKAI